MKPIEYMSLTGLKSLNDFRAESIMEPFIDESVLVRSEPLSLASPKSETLTANAPSSYVQVDGETVAPKPLHEACGIDMGLDSLMSIVYTDGTREKIPHPRTLNHKARRPPGRPNPSGARPPRATRLSVPPMSLTFISEYPSRTGRTVRPMRETTMRPGEWA